MHKLFRSPFRIFVTIAVAYFTIASSAFLVGGFLATRAGIQADETMSTIDWLVLTLGVALQFVSMFMAVPFPSPLPGSVPALFVALALDALSWAAVVTVALHIARFLRAHHVRR